jgi:hypothetical protein
MRCNEEVTVPFATIALTGVLPMGVAFPKPLLPWLQIRPNLLLDGVAIPRGCEYQVGYWIEDAAHHAIVSESHRPVRDIAFLGRETEVLIVAPSPELVFVLRDSEQAASATVLARVLWRSRL